ncbi:MAG: hypothetical protein AAFP15_20310, partial [Bacteroidota bacterium]
LEHPGFTFSKKVGILPVMQHKIEKIRFEYDSQQKILYNVNSGIVGQTRIRNHRNEVAERPFLKISMKSEKSFGYVQYIKNVKHREQMNFISPKASLAENFSFGGLHGRPVRVDYEDDPELSAGEYNSLSINEKFMYKFLHGRTSALKETFDGNEYEYAWRDR